MNAALGFFHNHMPHLIETICDTSMPETIAALESTHDFIVNCAIATQNQIGTDLNRWGAQLKRLEVGLPDGQILARTIHE